MFVFTSYHMHQKPYILSVVHDQLKMAGHSVNKSYGRRKNTSNVNGNVSVTFSLFIDEQEIKDHLKSFSLSNK